jgi:hypothetical protein
MFMDKLTSLSEGQQKLIGNTTLQEVLDWDEERYNRIKAELVDAEEIIVGRGRGGSVGLANAPGTSAALSVFISYSHADETIKNALLQHLKPLERLKIIDSWHDRKIKAGEEWNQKISDELENADIILLLISIDFINSAYCYDIELERAMELHSSGSAKIIPIIVRPCMWSHTSFAKLQALPKDAKAISGWDNQDEVLASIAEAVMQVAKDISATSKQ